jgi:TPR repeat protein
LDKREKVTIRYIGSFIDGSFKLGDLAVIEQQDTKNDFQSSTETYKYQKNGNKETLIIDDETKFQLTKEDAKFPSKYLNYAQYTNLVSLQNIKYANNDLLNKVKYNDKGTISFEFTNNSDIDIQNIKVVLSEQGKPNDIVFIGDSTRYFPVEKYKKLSGSINIHAGFRIPEDSVRFVISAYYQGDIPLFSKAFAVSTIPFFLNNKITSNNNSETLAALQGYCGFNKSKYFSPIEKLSILSTKGNKYAAFWKGMFLSNGISGLKLDKAKGLEIAKNSYNDVLAGARNGDAEALYLMYQAVRMGLSGGEVKNISLEFLQKSADAGFLPAKYDFATYLLMQKQYKESFDIFSSLYNTGMEKSALRLGYFYQKGFFVNKSIDKAVEWYNKGLAFGDPEAMVALAELYDSEDTTPDMVKAVSYAQKAATLKNVDGINFLAHTYRYGKGAIKKDIPKAMAYYKEAANLGDTKAVNILASEDLYQKVAEKRSNTPKNSKKTVDETVNYVVNDSILAVWNLLKLAKPIDKTSQAWEIAGNKALGTGICVSGDCENGYGINIANGNGFSTRSQYEGYFSNGKRDNKGVFTDAEGDLTAIIGDIRITKDASDILSHISRPSGRGFTLQDIQYFQHLAFADLHKCNCITPTYNAPSSESYQERYEIVSGVYGNYISSGYETKSRTVYVPGLINIGNENVYIKAISSREIISKKYDPNAKKLFEYFNSSFSLKSKKTTSLQTHFGLCQENTRMCFLGEYTTNANLVRECEEQNSISNVAQKLGNNKYKVDGYTRTTDIKIYQGDKIIIKANGEFKYENEGNAYSAEGALFGDNEKYFRNFAVGALLANVEDCVWNAVGENYEWTTECNGKLNIMINDHNPSNSSGGFIVEITIIRAPR